MKRHETGCTNNPERVCGMCRESGIGEEQQNITSLIKALKADIEGLSKLREIAQNCPACMLAAIRQSGLQQAGDEEGPGFSVDFDFQAEKIIFWNEVNDRNEYYY